SQRDIAEELGMTQGAVSKIEAGLLGISDELIHQLSDLLHYPPSFFYQYELRLGLGPSELYHYRKRSRVTERTLATFHTQLRVRRMQLGNLLGSVDVEADKRFPRFDVDEFRERGSDVARALRAAWHVPRGPVRNLTKLIEDAGALVMHFRFGTDLV